MNMGLVFCTDTYFYKRYQPHTLHLPFLASFPTSLTPSFNVPALDYVQVDIMRQPERLEFGFINLCWFPLFISELIRTLAFRRKYMNSTMIMTMMMMMMMILSWNHIPRLHRCLLLEPFRKWRRRSLTPQIYVLRWLSLLHHVINQIVKAQQRKSNWQYFLRHCPDHGYIPRGWPGRNKKSHF